MTKPEFSMRTRAANLERMQGRIFDLAVIGGGVTGGGVSLDAASRGLSVALIEKGDFASGTSSRSSKLIHGGLRYLGQLQFGFVREALSERATLIRIAPHLTEPLAFLIPVYTAGRRSPLGRNTIKLRVGLWLYDLLAGHKSIGSHRWLTRDETLQLAPTLEARGLRGCFLHYDCLTNDSRLVLEVIKAAAAHGALMANYAAARNLKDTGGRVSGVEVEDCICGRRIELRARVVINATGVWSDEVSGLSHAPARTRLRRSKGIHVILPSERFNIQASVLIPSLGEHRFLFVIPWQGRVVVGTTDSDYSGELDNPVADEQEIKRLVDSAADYFPGAELSTEQVISAFAGLRPLVSESGKSTTELSRKEEIIENESGLISIIGGKLTTYRRTAERVVDRVVAQLRRAGDPRFQRPPQCVTERIELAGGAVSEDEIKTAAARAGADYDLPPDTVEHLMRTYGGNYKVLLDIVRQSDELKSQLIDCLPHIEAEVVYAARYEMAATAEDFLSRRTRIALLARDHGRSCAIRVASLMGQELCWSTEELRNALAGLPM